LQIQTPAGNSIAQPTDLNRDVHQQELPSAQTATLNPPAAESLHFKVRFSVLVCHPSIPIAYVCPNESAPTTEMGASPIHEAPAEPELPRTRRCRNTIIDSVLGERMCGREDCPGKWIRSNCVTAKE
jgi:hypothetical protein